MTTSIIDPSILTEEQREVIREAYKLVLISANITKYDSGYRAGWLQTLDWLFGEEFFNEKGE